MTFRVPYRDLHPLPEDERIRLIGEKAATQLVGVLLEKDEPAKIARYIEKVQARFKNVRHIDTTDGPTSLVVTLRFGPTKASMS